ncbi:hypothetical protein [Levilactobacillus sp. HBUAS70063]|uniref:hypothetical protein n=1 Tax=Levilactobacillus sp. HBUAS70063 TaxID=3109359 RepID=UPI003132F8D1
MEQLAINGKIMDEPKVLKMSPILLYVKIEDDTGAQVNCLVHKHGLNFLYEATAESRVALYGHYNWRKQFVIDKYTVMATAAQKVS